MKHLGWMIVVSLLAACTALMDKGPVSRSVLLQVSPDVAYQRATRAMAQMGAEVTHANAQSGLLSGRVHNAVVLTVTVTGTPDGARIEAVGSLMPNKLAVGRFTEVEDYLALVQEARP